MKKFQVAGLAKTDQLPGPTITRHNLPLIIFFLWGFVKDVVCNTKVTNLQDLRSWITAACALVDANMLSQTWQELVYCLDVLVQQTELTLKCVDGMHQTL